MPPPGGVAHAQVRTVSVFLFRMRRILPTPSRHCVLLQHRHSRARLVRNEQRRTVEQQQGRWRGGSGGGGQGGAVLLGSRGAAAVHAGWALVRQQGRQAGHQGSGADGGARDRAIPQSQERGGQLQGLWTHHLLWLKPKSCILGGGQGRNSCRLPPVKMLWRCEEADKVDQDVAS